MQTKNVNEWDSPYQYGCTKQTRKGLVRLLNSVKFVLKYTNFEYIRHSNLCYL